MTASASILTCSREQIKLVVANVDIPLSQQMDELALIQLHQHLLMEMTRRQLEHVELQHKKGQLLKELESYSQRLVNSAAATQRIIQQGLADGDIVDKMVEHRRALKAIEQIERLHETYEQTLLSVFQQARLLNESEWQQLEALDSQLDEQVETVMLQLQQLTAEIAHYAEKHERQFLLINTLLGVTALLVGLLLTAHIIRSFRAAVGALHQQLDSIRNAFRQTPLPEHSWLKPEDELQQLQQNLETLSESLSKELINRDQAEQELVELATKDALTGVYNRNKWNDLLKTEISLATADNNLAVLIIDVDHFKQINDQFGHDVGDKALIVLAQKIEQLLNWEGLLFRLGGEEFAVLTRTNSAPDLRLLAERIRQNVAELQVDNVPPMTVSIGVTYLREQDTAKSFVKRADNLLYQAKQAGRNQVLIE